VLKAVQGLVKALPVGDLEKRLAGLEKSVAKLEVELRKAVASVNGMGIQLQEPLEGLIEFPSYRNGEQIELCWKLGEERVEHWHRVGEGFAGRKKL